MSLRNATIRQTASCTVKCLDLGHEPATSPVQVQVVHISVCAAMQALPQPVDSAEAVQ